MQQNILTAKPSPLPSSPVQLHAGRLFMFT